MPGRLARLSAVLAALLGCGADDPTTALPAPGVETQSPPAEQRQAIEASLAAWAPGRFQQGRPRWFTLEPHMSPVQVVKHVDNELAGAAERLMETGPDGIDAHLSAWRLKRAARDGLVVAVMASRQGPGLAAFYPVKRSPNWTGLPD